MLTFSNPFKDDRRSLVKPVEGQDDQNAEEWGKAVFDTPLII